MTILYLFWIYALNRMKFRPHIDALGRDICLGSRLRAVDTNAGSAVLGALLIASIEDGLGLLGPSSGTKFAVAGLVLLAAAVVDSFAHRRQERVGEA